MPDSQAVNSQASNPLGTQPIGRLMLKFAIPAIISMLVNAIYNIVDQIFIGNSDIGMLGIAATNVAFPLVTIGTAVALLLGIGGASNFNLSLGRGEEDNASSSAGNSISLMLIAGGTIAVLAIVFLEPMLMLFGATDEFMGLAISYTRIIAIGIPFMIFTTGGCHLVRADGAPTYSMICLVSGAAFNLIFDPIFLFVFDMGIEGIALATTLGQVLTAVLAAFYLWRKFKSVPLQKKHLRPRAKFAGIICALGMASCLNQIAMTIVQIALNNTLRHYGGLSMYGSSIPIAAVGAISKINVLFMSFTIGISQGAQPLNGFNYGAKKYDRVRQTYLIAAVSATIAACLAFAAFQLFPRQIIGIFGEGSDLYYQFAVRYLRVYMVMTFLNGLQPVTSGFFTSIGKAKIGAFLSLTRQVLFLLPLILLLPVWLGIDGVMYAGPIADGVAAVVSVIFAAREVRELTQLHKQQQALARTTT